MGIADNKSFGYSHLSTLKSQRLSVFFSLQLACAYLWALAAPLHAQTALTWDQIKQRFIASNPTLMAAQINVDESRMNEVTAYLRPNPDFTISADGTQLTPYRGVWQPFTGTQVSPA